MPRPPSIWCFSHANLQALYYSHACPPPPAGKPLSCRHPFTPCQATRQTRRYAQHGVPPDLLAWPEAVKPHSTPTPYQILDCRRGSAYNKRRFYELVKLYHPDRCHSSAVAQLPLQVRLERYRMLVAAHDILSDIQKRKAYDAWGHGWVGQRSTPDARYESWQYDERRWASDPRHNATWEDWERWYHENDGTKVPDTRTMQLSNFAFWSLVLAFVTVGGALQGTRLTSANSSVMERREQVHRQTSIELRRSKDATLSGDRNERIRTFVDHRESTDMGEPSYQRLLPPSDTCTPDAVRRQ